MYIRLALYLARNVLKGLKIRDRKESGQVQTECGIVKVKNYSQSESAVY